ncbi:hypothetical protein ADL15_04165 [Actinoplanes awajinensis subsp. mycoplanecinus]|uniref:Uncharacterized protein n=2 Tax=Actinoplanes awajinensis TaxID=135946 RepID=A0A0X3V9K6_9ACTN|nr:hypothetical protein ADL15_04165 [Actinoplanes awajinensis subsp. mycoplanecinus]
MSGWRSDFLPAPAQLRAQRVGLLALMGRRVRAGWTGWDPIRELWQPVLPLVLVFDDGVQLELAWEGWESLSITWNTIDLETPPLLVGQPHEWRSSHPVVDVAGRVLTGWAVTESPYFDGESDLTGELPMDEVKGWFIQGLWIQFAGRDLHVYNGANVTGLSNDPVVPGDEGHTRLTHRELPDGAFPFRNC